MNTTPKPQPTSTRRRADESIEVMLAKHMRIRATMEPTGISLTWAEATAGKACNGCGLEVMGDARWRGRVPAARRAEYASVIEREAARFAAAHPECSGIAISSTTSTVRHCVDCCPPLPTQSGSIDPNALSRGAAQMTSAR